jgi:hypothetical protein
LVPLLRFFHRLKNFKGATDPIRPPLKHMVIIIQWFSNFFARGPISGPCYEKKVRSGSTLIEPNVKDFWFRNQWWGVKASLKTSAIIYKIIFKHTYYLIRIRVFFFQDLPKSLKNPKFKNYRNNLKLPVFFIISTLKYAWILINVKLLIVFWFLQWI